MFSIILARMPKLKNMLVNNIKSGLINQSKHQYLNKEMLIVKSNLNVHK